MLHTSPASPSKVLGSDGTLLVSPLNRKYLRAFHDYVPAQPTLSSSAGVPSVTVTLQAGDVILIHLTHANGWADGTVLSSGKRGWLPTNYCEAYDHRLVRPLLHALTKLWNSLMFADEDHPWPEEQDGHLQPIIAGVRYMLEECSCLHRRDALVKAHLGLQQTRISLLSELSSLIRQQKRLMADSSQDVSSEELSTQVEAYVTRAFHIANGAVRFLDLWTQHTSMNEQLGTDPFQGSLWTSGSAPGTGSVSSKVTEDGDESASLGATPYEYDGHDYLSPRISGNPNSREDRGRQNSENAFAATPPLGSMEYLDKAESACDLLAAAHDDFLDHIDTFIGLRMQSRSFSELSQSTSRSLKSCIALLATVNAIYEQGSQYSMDFEESLQSFRDSTMALAKATRTLLDITSTHESPAFLDPPTGRSLVTAATACVRCAGECVGEARKLLDEDGDFDVEVKYYDLSDDDEEKAATKTCTLSDTEALPTALEEERKSRPISNAETRNASREMIRLDSPRRGAIRPGSVEENTLRKTFRMSSPPISSTVTLADSLGARKPRSLTTNDSLSRAKHATEDQPPTPPISGDKIRNRKTASTSTNQDSLRYSMRSAVSTSSTRATTPDRSMTRTSSRDKKSTSLTSAPSFNFADGDGHSKPGERSYSHELVYGKDDQVLGGSLRALVEILTSQNSLPDAMTIKTFYLTFRSFTDASELTEVLIDRYDKAGETTIDSTPARLRVFNFFKQWLEFHWDTENDTRAVDAIRNFAEDRMMQLSTTAGDRLLVLVDRAVEAARNNDKLAGLASPTRKTFNRTLSQHGESETSESHSLVTKGQISLLRNALAGGPSCSVLDFDALELARQITLIDSALYCAVEPKELLGSAWTKKTAKTPNIRALSRLSTDIANYVAETILYAEDIKRRVAKIKHWIKVAKHCLILNNYDTLMAIVCSLGSSMVARLRQTWALIPQKTQAHLDNLKSIVDITKNYSGLRQRLRAAQLPCLPFVGIYLTDLTFVDAGNADTRQIPSNDDPSGYTSGINFDKHMRTVKIIDQLQKFQEPYQFKAIVIMQDWIRSQITRANQDEVISVASFYKRSLEIEPRGEGGRDDSQARSGANLGVPFFSYKKSSRLDEHSRDRSEVRSRFGLAVQKSYSDMRSKMLGSAQS